MGVRCAYKRYYPKTMGENEKQEEQLDDSEDIDLRRLLKDLEDPKKVAAAQERVKNFFKEMARDTDHQQKG